MDKSIEERHHFDGDMVLHAGITEGPGFVIMWADPTHDVMTGDKCVTCGAVRDKGYEAKLLDVLDAVYGRVTAVSNDCVEKDCTHSITCERILEKLREVRGLMEECDV